MKTDTPKTIYLKDYTPPAYKAAHIDLTFKIFDEKTIVTARTQYSGSGTEPLALNGEHLKVLSVFLDGERPDYTEDDKGIIIPAPGKKEFTLEIETEIDPASNTRLEGLYMSGGNWCTQCEAEGFRTITCFQDRPDVMATFTVRIEADKKTCPVLLSNGNLTDKGDLDDGRHYAVWDDPFPKPCYLFALVAGDLQYIQDTFKTAKGRKVDLRIYVRDGDQEQCGWAMESLKQSMKWDEEQYGRIYDYDRFNIVAVSDFNMGAMENTSLNIFNTALVLAQPETATDVDFGRVEGVIAHEYFHNWTGNRVTCRDWFQLSLKEGLTVFRDQEFSADMNSRGVKRIDDVALLRRMQFAEDAGPMAHPIRPDNYIEINNFYTVTVYEKGAEVIRMQHTLLGTEAYRKATDLYFDRHDGQAVTCDDFVQCMQDASGTDLTQFRLWYSQAGTPEITAKGHYDEKARSYTLELAQHVPPTPGQPKKEPMHIPVRVGLVGPNGADMAEQLLELKEAKQKFVFEDIPSKPVPSILRGFSAPVKLKTDLTEDDLRFLMVHDSDGFNQWEAGQNYMLGVLHAMIGGKDLPNSFLEAYDGLLERALRPDSDKALMARTIAIPDVLRIGQDLKTVDPDAIYEARQSMLAAIKRTYKPKLEKLYKENRSPAEFTVSAEAVGRRSLQNMVLSLLTATCGTGCARLAKEQYDSANNMTDRVAALSRLSDNDNAERVDAFGDFYEHFKSYPLVMDKWFSLQAASQRKNALEDIKKLREHKDFNIKNPNRARALYGAFAMSNPVRFHDKSGNGYEFLADAIIELNAINPQIAARMVTPLREWRRYTSDRQDKMKAQLERIAALPGLSNDVFEVVSKTLKA